MTVTAELTLAQAARIVREAVRDASIQTTGDVYADWDLEALAQTMADVLGEDDE